MGSRITKLSQHQGFSASTGGSIMLFTASLLGIPVSTTHTITGCDHRRGRRAAGLGGALGRRAERRHGLADHHPRLGQRRGLFYWLTTLLLGLRLQCVLTLRQERAMTQIDLSDAHTARTSLEGKRVIVSGGTTGIGRAIAVLLASEGAKVFICGRDERHLADGLERIREVGEGDGVALDLA